MYLKQNIKHLRITKLRLKQEELGEKIGKSKYDISNYETGKASISVDSLIKLSEIFGTDLNTLVFANLEAGDDAGVKEPMPEYKIDLKEEICRLWNRIEELEGRVKVLEAE